MHKFDTGFDMGKAHPTQTTDPSYTATADKEGNISDDHTDDIVKDYADA